MCHICCLHWIAALISIFTSWNVRLWIQVIQDFTLNLNSYNIKEFHFIWDTNIYISFQFQSCRSKYACVGSTRNHTIIYYSAMRKNEKYDFSLCGHQWSRNYFYDIFCLSWHLISLFYTRNCIFQLMLVIRE